MSHVNDAYRDAVAPRARLACQRCNSRKTRCVKPTSEPCESCTAAGTRCEPIVSQRGRYSREQHKRHRRRTRETLTTQPIGPDSNLHRDHMQVDMQTVRDMSHVDAADDPSDERQTSRVLHSPDRTPQDVYVSVAEAGLNQGQQAITQTDNIVFLGEAFSLTYVLHNVLAPFLTTGSNYRSRLHYPIADPTLAATRAGRTRFERQKQHLVKLGLYSRPEDSTMEEMMQAYFNWFNPAFPMIDRSEFCRKVRNGEDVSLLLLNAVLLIAVTIRDQPVTSHPPRPIDRHREREVYFRQAKALFDEDLEPNKTDLVCGLFLMSFWWERADDPKDTWFWMGSAVSLAQSQGMHRSLEDSSIDPTMRVKWKKIWWSLRTREALVSGSIGRPEHYSDEDCDVELLSMEDFPEQHNPRRHTEAAYACYMARLGRIMSRIIRSRHSPSGRETYRIQEARNLLADLRAFRNTLPDVLRYKGFDADKQSGLWTAMMNMAFNYAAILLCRPSRSVNTTHMDNTWGDISETRRAASEITRTMEDILSASAVNICQIHTIPALFNALAIHMLDMCTSDSLGRSLAENRAQICMIGLSYLQDSWPVGGWVYKLFIYALQQLRDQLDRISKQRALAMLTEPANTCQTSTQSLNIPGVEKPCTIRPTTNGSSMTGTHLSPELSAENDTFLTLDEILSGLGEQGHFFESLQIPDWGLRIFDQDPRLILQNEEGVSSIGIDDDNVDRLEDSDGARW